MDFFMLAMYATHCHALFVFFSVLPVVSEQGSDAQLYVAFYDQKNEANAEKVNGLGCKAGNAPDKRKCQEERVENNVGEKAAFLDLQIKLSK